MNESCPSVVCYYTLYGWLAHPPTQFVSYLVVQALQASVPCLRGWSMPVWQTVWPLHVTSMVAGACVCQHLGDIYFFFFGSDQDELA